MGGRGMDRRRGKTTWDTGRGRHPHIPGALGQPPTARPRLLPPRLGGGDFPLFRRPGVGASWGSPLPQSLLCRE